MIRFALGISLQETFFVKYFFIKTKIMNIEMAEPTKHTSQIDMTNLVIVSIRFSVSESELAPTI